MLQPDAFADMVVLTIKTALGPVLERLAVAEQSNKELQSRVLELSGLRDRVVTVETKSAQPPPVVPIVDLTPLLERLAASEQRGLDLQERVDDLLGMRDRLVTIETKAAQPVPLAPLVPDLVPVLERLAVAEDRLSVLGDVRDRLVTVETKAAMPAPIIEVPKPVDLVPVLDRLGKAETLLSECKDRVVIVEAKAAQPVPVVAPAVGPSLAEQELALVNRVEPLTKQMAALSERLVVVETRAPMPGPAGKDGADGAPGLNGKDGADGVGFDDLTVEQQDERTAVVKAAKGERVKPIGTLKFNHEVYRNVWSDSATYERGDCCTWAGSEWHCNEQTTTKPGDGSKAWTLKVKRGRDGRDGRDAPEALPVVTVGRN